MDKNKKLAEGLLKADGINPEGATESERIAFGKMLDEQSKQKTSKPSIDRPDIWRLIMRSKITKLTVAAVIIIAAMVVINQFGGSIDGSSVAWADVVERVEQVQTYVHRTTQTLEDPTKSSKSMVYYSTEEGKKIEVYKGGQIIMYVYVLLEDKAAISIMPEGKKSQKILLTEEELQDELQGGDPRMIVTQFLSMNYKKLGKDKIDGIETEVIEVKNPKIASDMYVTCTGRLWVDVETNLPVRIEIDGVAKGGIGRLTQVVDKLQWNAEFDANVFEPTISSDYTVIDE